MLRLILRKKSGNPSETYSESGQQNGAALEPVCLLSFLPFLRVKKYGLQYLSSVRMQVSVTN